MLDWNAQEAALAIRRGEVLAEDYAATLLDQCERNNSLNAFIAIDRDALLESARNADLHRRAGKSLGPLHGVPLAVKDMILSSALPTSAGTPALRNFRPHEDAEVLRRLFANGALLLGKNNTHELGLGWTNNNAAFGPARNPYDSSRIPGGSSGGTAVAVAAFMAPAGVGTDAAGSVRVPASLCGVCALRPSMGRYPHHGIVSTQPSFATAGLMARSVADLALLDSTITGEANHLDTVHLKIARLGVPRGYFFDGLEYETKWIVEAALDCLRDAGVTLIDEDIPGLELAIPTFLAIARTEAKEALSKFLRDNYTGVTFGQLIRQVGSNVQSIVEQWFLESSVGYPSPEEYETAVRFHRPALQMAIERHMRHHHLQAIVFPPLMMPATSIGVEGEIEIEGKSVAHLTAFGRNTLVGSCARVPGLVIPAGVTRTGLPVGIELDGLINGDRQLLALGRAIQCALACA